METKKSVKFWMFFIVFAVALTYGLSELIKCPPNRCNLDIFRTVITIGLLILGIYGMWTSKDSEPSIKDLIEKKEE